MFGVPTKFLRDLVFVKVEINMLVDSKCFLEKKTLMAMAQFLRKILALIAHHYFSVTDLDCTPNPHRQFITTWRLQLTIVIFVNLVNLFGFETFWLVPIFQVIKDSIPTNYPCYSEVIHIWDSGLSWEQNLE